MKQEHNASDHTAYNYVLAHFCLVVSITSEIQMMLICSIAVKTFYFFQFLIHFRHVAHDSCAKLVRYTLCCWSPLRKCTCSSRSHCHLKILFHSIEHPQLLMRWFLWMVQEFVGVIYAMGQVGTLIGVAFYHRYLRHWTFRSLLFWVQLLLALSGMLDLVLVTGLNRKLLIPDYIFAITDEGVSQVSSCASSHVQIIDSWLEVCCWLSCIFKQHPHKIGLGVSVWTFPN